MQRPTKVKEVKKRAQLPFYRWCGGGHLLYWMPDGSSSSAPTLSHKAQTGFNTQHARDGSRRVQYSIEIILSSL